MIQEHRTAIGISRSGGARLLLTGRNPLALTDFRYMIHAEGLAEAAVNTCSLDFTWLDHLATVANLSCRCLSVLIGIIGRVLEGRFGGGLEPNIPKYQACIRSDDRVENGILSGVRGKT